MIKSSKIGFSKAYIAIYHPETMTYDAPLRLEAVQSAKITANVTSLKTYADDALFEVLDVLDNFEMELTFADLTPAEQALLLGWKSVGALKISGVEDNPPWLAFFGERRKINKAVRYFKYLKGKASAGSEDMKTKGGSAQEQADAIKITFGPLPDNFLPAAFAGTAKIVADTDDPEYDGEGEIWYDSVIPGV